MLQTKPCCGLFWQGEIRVILGYYGDNGREHGNYFNGFYKVYIMGYMKTSKAEIRHL